MTSILAALITGCIAIVSQPFVQPMPSQPPHVDAKRLEAHVKHLSVDLYPRSFDQARNTERAAQYVLDAFKAAGGTVSVQEITVEEATYKNIVTRFGPASGPVLVIGAHYDSHGDTALGAQSDRGYSADSHTPGADDNASGVAGLIELAQLLAKQPPAQAVELVAYALEEPPHFRTEHMGSAWHTRLSREAGREVRMMISLEMIGYFSEAAGSQHYPVPGMSALYPDRGNFIAIVGNLENFSAMRRIKAIMAGATDLPVESVNAPRFIPGIDFSDHLNYWNAGLPALMVTDTAFMRNQNYHLPGDTFDKLDYIRMAKVVQAVFAITQHY